MLILAQIIKKTVKVMAIVMAILSATVIAPHAAMAQAANCTTADNKPGIYVQIAVNGTHCFPVNGDSFQTNPIFLYIAGLLKAASALAGIATLGGIIWGALMYITARANAAQVEKARLVIVNSILGLILFIFMFAILQYLVPGGLFS